MQRTTGVKIYGIRGPVIQQGDNLVNIVVDSLLDSCEAEEITLKERDILGTTESTLARSQGNYVDTNQIANEVNRKLGADFTVVNPILSRNRFAPILKGLARGADKLTLALSYPADEVGNPIMPEEKMDELEINPRTRVFTIDEYRLLFSRKEVVHPFTGVDYLDLYHGIISDESCEPTILLVNDLTQLNHDNPILVASIHARKKTKRLLKKQGAKTVLGLDDLCNESVNGGGYCPDFGLLGSNLAGNERLKLFPHSSQNYVNAVQQEIKKRTGVTVEVLVYGDGAFRCPRSNIWEFADPEVCPAYTSGLEGQPNELKFKYHADTELGDLRGPEAENRIRLLIKNKSANLVGQISSQGTTPRRLTDLLGSLCDLTTGSGDKGTPFVLIKGYFDTYADQ